MKKFRFSIANSSGGALVLYFLAGIYNTLKITNTITQAGTSPFAVSAVASAVGFQNVTDLVNAGFPTGYVLDDGTLVSGLVATAGDSTRKIRDFVTFIKRYPHKLRQLTIAADAASYFSEEIVFSNSLPLQKSEAKDSLLLSTIRDKYQTVTTEMDIFFKEGTEQPPRMLGASSIMYGSIPTGRTITYTFIFD